METLEALSGRIGTTEEIRSIVRTMKSLSAVSIRQYERAIEALEDYQKATDLGFQTVLRRKPSRIGPALTSSGRTAAVVFGSDRGLCGRFNERIANLVRNEIAAGGEDWGEAPLLLVVGMRASARLEAGGLAPEETFFLPGSAAGLTRTAQSILVEADRWREMRGIERIRVYHNRRVEGATAEPVSRLLLPLSREYLERLSAAPWPTRCLPDYRMETGALFSWLVREHLLLSLFRAGAESLASEHASRLAAMRGAESNIDERLDTLSAAYRRTRQDAITTELMDIVTGTLAMESDAAG